MLPVPPSVKRTDNQRTMAALECLQGLVGVTDVDCDCYAQGDEWTPSLSGKYLTDGISIEQLALGRNCGEADNIITIGDRVINEAILWTQGILPQAWMNQGRLKHRALFDEATADFNGNVDSPINATYAGHRYKLKPIRGGKFIINTFHTYFTGDGSVNVLVYDDRELIETINVTIANGQATTILETPLEIPFFEDGIFRPYIDLIFQPGTPKPRNNSTKCLSCNPSFRQRLQPWAELKGIFGSDLDSRKDWACSDKAFGLVPRVKFECNASEAICAAGMKINVDPHAMTVAEVIYYKALHGLADDLLKKPEPSRYTALSGEELTRLKEESIAEAMARVDQLSKSELPLISGCFTCDHKGGHTPLSF